jgi:Mg-chelatase subunit ChlD
LVEEFLAEGRVRMGRALEYASVAAGKRADARMDAQTNSHTGTKSHAKAGVRSDVQANSNAGIKSDMKAGVRTGIRSDVKSDVQTAAHAGITSDVGTGVHIGIQKERDSWLSRVDDGTVVFRDVSGDGAGQIVGDELAAVARLRAVFFRVMSRKRYGLEDSGSEVDVPAYIQRVVRRQPGPVFRQAERSRGFSVLVLVDRSTSMQGAKTAAVERAVRILGAALEFPFVEFAVWGFQGRDAGEIVLTRFLGKRPVLSSRRATVDGATPLHLAVEVGSRALGERQSAKHLLLLTDGMPAFVASSGQDVSRKVLVEKTRRAVQQARAGGIKVDCGFVGRRGSDARLAGLLGARGGGRWLSEKRLTEDLVAWVTGCFSGWLLG